MSAFKKTLAVAFAGAALGLAGCEQAPEAPSQPRFDVKCYNKEGTQVLFSKQVYDSITDEGAHYLYETKKAYRSRNPTDRVPTEGCFIRNLR